jgi:site-specific recombinase XerD
MATDLRLRGMSPVTQRMYLACVRRFAAYHHRSPTALGETEVRAFLDHLVRERRMSPATLRVYGAALRFLYHGTLGRPDVVRRVPYPRRVPERLPEILSPAEVEQLLGALRSLKHRAMVMVAYGAGLRVSELCALTATDIDSARMLIRVRAGKGDKDRYVMLLRSQSRGRGFNSPRLHSSELFVLCRTQALALRSTSLITVW